MRDLDAARSDATRSSGGGVAFLLAYGATLLLAGGLALVLPVGTAALLVLCQGVVALPLAFVLQRRLGLPPMAAENPLRPLVAALALVQVVALPAVILVYALDPAFVPPALAAIAGGHFLPYAWLHRTRVYVVLGVAVSLGALLLVVLLGRAAFPVVPLFMAGCYWGAALLLWRVRRPGT